MQTDPPVCVLPDDVQEGLRELYDDVSQIKTDIGSLKNLEQMLEAVSAAQEQGNTLSKGLQDDVNQMKADITRLKQTLEKVSKAQGEEPPLFINILIVLVTSFIAYQTLIIWLKTRNLDRMDKKLDKALGNMDSPNWLEQIRSVVTIMVGIITIPTLVFSLLKYTSTSTSSPDMRPPQQEQSLEATSSPAEGPL